MKKTLYMVFTLGDDSGVSTKTMTLSLQSPKDGLTTAEVDALGQSIVTKKAFLYNGFYPQGVKEAYIRQVDDVELA